MDSSGGSFVSTQKCSFGPFDCWFNKDCLANILSMALVSEMFRITLDSEIENALVIHITETYKIKFIRVDCDLYAYDATNDDIEALHRGFLFLQTVEGNKAMYQKRDVRKADQAVSIGRMINHPAKDKFARIIKDNWIRNCPVTIGDVKCAEVIYGPSLPSIQGRTRDQETPRVPELPIIPLPKELYESLKNVTLCVDYHFVDNVTVFHTISRRIAYRTVDFPISRSRASDRKSVV